MHVFFQNLSSFCTAGCSHKIWLVHAVVLILTEVCGPWAPFVDDIMMIPHIQWWIEVHFDLDHSRKLFQSRQGAHLNADHSGASPGTSILIYLFIADTKSIVWTHTLCRTQVDKNRQYRTWYKTLKPAISQGYRHLLQLHWRQNHGVTDTFLTLLLAET